VNWHVRPVATAVHSVAAGRPVPGMTVKAARAIAVSYTL